MLHSLAFLFAQLQQGRLCDERPRVVVEENRSVHIDQSRAHTPTILVHIVRFFGVLLHHNRLAGFRKPGWMKPVTDHQTPTITFLDGILSSEIVVKHDRGPTPKANVFGYRRKFISHQTSQFDQELSRNCCT